MKSEEFGSLARIRNGVETVSSSFRKNYHLDRLPGGKQRGKFFFGSKIAALNFRKLFGFRKGLGNKDSAIENSMFWPQYHNIVYLQPYPGRTAPSHLPVRNREHPFWESSGFGGIVVVQFFKFAYLIGMYIFKNFFTCAVEFLQKI